MSGTPGTAGAFVMAAAIVVETTSVKAVVAANDELSMLVTDPDTVTVTVGPSQEISVAVTMLISELASATLPGVETVPGSRLENVEEPASMKD